MEKEGFVISENVYSGIKGKIIIKLMNLIHRFVHKWFVEKLNIKSNDRVLDVGCGGGTLLAMMSQNTNKKICGIDFSDDMILAARKKNSKKISSGDVEVLKASVSKIPYKNENFSVVTSFETIQFWPDINNDLLEIKRVMKEDGKFYIMNRLPNVSSKWYDFSQLKAPNDYKEALEEAGFNNIIVDTDSKKGWILVIASK